MSFVQRSFTHANSINWTIQKFNTELKFAHILYLSGSWTVTAAVPDQPDATDDAGISAAADVFEPIDCEPYRFHRLAYVAH